MKNRLPQEIRFLTRTITISVSLLMLAQPALSQSASNLADSHLTSTSSAAYPGVYPMAASSTAKQFAPDNATLPNIPQPCTVMFHGIVPPSESTPGAHTLQIKVYSSDATMLDQAGKPAHLILHEESVVATVAQGAYNITLNNVPAGIKTSGQEIVLGITIDNRTETLWPVKLHHATEFTNTTGQVYIAYLDEQRLRANAAAAGMTNNEQYEVAQKGVPTMAVQEVNPLTGNVKIKTLADYSGTEYKAPMSVRLEYGVAGPMGLQYNTMSAMQFGRASVDVMNVTTLFGAHLGLGARMMRSGNDFRYYSGGIVADVNNDGSVLATIGVAKYQTGTDLNQVSTISPFSRIQYFTSPRGVFLYGEVEATVHLKSYISGTAGVGVRFLGIELIAGYHYSMYVLPDIATTQTVNGFNSIASFSF